MVDYLFGDLNKLDFRAQRLSRSQLGVHHNWEIEPLVPAAGDEPTVTVRIELGQSIESVYCRLLEPERRDVALRLVGIEWDELNWSYSQVWQGQLPARGDGELVQYQIKAFGAGDGDSIAAEDNTTFAYLVGEASSPDWSKDAIIYQIMPDRFHPGTGRTWNPVRKADEIYGGTLRGIIENLDYIQDLGVNCLWLNPFFPDRTHHGYHATDYFNVNPRLGTLEEMRELVESSRQRGIRLLLDFVANHWGSEHPYFQAAQMDRESEYYPWFLWKDWPHGYETYFSVQQLPKLNVDHPGVRSYLLEAASFWLMEIGFAGLRLDYAHGVSLNFWTWFRKEIKSIKPQAWLFGEVTDSAAVQLKFAGRLDGCLDFLLTQALRNAFALESMTLSQLDAFLDAHERYFPGDFSRPSFLDNHDMDRFLHLAAGDVRKLKLAALCQFTLSGPPIVYYGTEAGVTQKRSVRDSRGVGLPESRQSMLWEGDQDKDLHAFYRWLIQLRRAHPVLSRGKRRTLHVDDQTQVYAYERYDSSEQIIVVFNLSEEPSTLEAAGHAFQLPPLSGEVRITNLNL